MTTQHRHLVSLDEIISLNYECNKCHAKMTILINDERKLPHACAHCGDRWIVGDPFDIESTGPHAATFKAILDLQQSIRFIVTNTSRIGCAFSLEIKEEENGKAT